MNATPLNVTREAAHAALLEYRRHRATYDAQDKEIARIYWAISRGRKVISAFDAIREAGIDELGRPKLALMRADQKEVRCIAWNSSEVIYTSTHRSRAAEWYFVIPWLGRAVQHRHTISALLPRIPPQHRPENLADYHLLWEADWQSIPSDPYLLKRIGKDAWVILAGWDLSEVELNVLRAHQT